MNRRRCCDVQPFDKFRDENHKEIPVGDGLDQDRCWFLVFEAEPPRLLDGVVDGEGVVAVDAERRDPVSRTTRC